MNRQLFTYFKLGSRLFSIAAPRKCFRRLDHRRSAIALMAISSILDRNFESCDPRALSNGSSTGLIQDFFVGGNDHLFPFRIKKGEVRQILPSDYQTDQLSHLEHFTTMTTFSQLVWLKLAGFFRRLEPSFCLKNLRLSAVRDDCTILIGSEATAVTDRRQKGRAYRCWCFNFTAYRKYAGFDLDDGACQYPVNLSSCHYFAVYYVAVLS